MRLASWGVDLLDLLLPAGCVACRSWIPGGRGAPLVCDRCRSRLREAAWPRCERCHHPRATGRAGTALCPECEAWPEALTSARHAFVLGGPADELVHALKYEGWRELASVMGDAVAGLVGGLPGPAGERRVVVPVPTTSRRVRVRGYNQAELLAKRVAEACDLPLDHALVRPGRSRSQTALTPEERRANVRGAFVPAAAGGAPVRGAHVLLIDDVLTTGATASEAATALADMGVAAVTLLTFARALVGAPGKTRSGLS